MFSFIVVMATTATLAGIGWLVFALVQTRRRYAEARYILKRWCAYSLDGSISYDKHPLTTALDFLKRTE